MLTDNTGDKTGTPLLEVWEKLKRKEILSAANAMTEMSAG